MPSGNKAQPLRGDVAMEIRKELPQVTRSRIVTGQAIVNPRGQDSDIVVAGKSEVSVELRQLDGKAGTLILPKKLTMPVLVIRGFGAPIVVKLSGRKMSFDAALLLRFAQLTSTKVLRLEIFGRARGVLASMRLRVVIDPATKSLRLVY